MNIINDPHTTIVNDPHMYFCQFCGSKPGDVCYTQRGNVSRHPHIMRMDMADLYLEEDNRTRDADSRSQ